MNKVIYTSLTITVLRFGTGSSVMFFYDSFLLYLPRVFPDVQDIWFCIHMVLLYWLYTLSKFPGEMHPGGFPSQ